MKKISPTSRVIDIFSTESLESCEILLDVAQGIVKQRRDRNMPGHPTRPKRAKALGADVAPDTELTGVNR